MPRSKPSEADLELIERAEAAGHRITPSRLEAWRQRGLIPRPTVIRVKGGGTRVQPHSDLVLQMCCCLASAPAQLGLAHRLGAWQDGAFMLFEDGFPVRQEVLQASLTWWLGNVTKAAVNLWKEAAASFTFGPGRLTDDALSEIAEKTAEISARNKQLRVLRSALIEEFRRNQYIVGSRDEVAGAAYEALGLRLALLAGVSLPPELESVARFGRNGTPPKGLTPVLPHEAYACAETLTAREAYSMARLQRARVELMPDPAAAQPQGWSLVWANLGTASDRLATPPYDIRVPLDEQMLSTIERMTRDLRDELFMRDSEEAAPLTPSEPDEA